MNVYVYWQACMYIYGCVLIHTYVILYGCMLIGEYVCLWCAWIGTYVHLWMYIDTYVCNFIWMYADTLVCIFMIYMNRYVCTLMGMSTHVTVWASIPYIHTNIHTYIHTYIHTLYEHQYWWTCDYTPSIYSIYACNYTCMQL